MGNECGWRGFDEQPTLLTGGTNFLVTNGQTNQPRVTTDGSGNLIRNISQNIENLIITNLSNDPLIVRINPHKRETSNGTVVDFPNRILLLPTDPPFELRDRPIFKVEVEATEGNQAFRFNEW